jgi:N-methylhydantoinase A
MERAIRAISIERGYDPRRFTLVAFGGAGPLHACELASALSIPRVLIPPHPGVLSALGMVLTDVIKDYSQTVMLPADRATAEDMIRLFLPLRERAHADLSQEGLAEEQMHMVPALDMRYVGQSYELTIPLAADTDLAEIRGQAHIERFHTTHRQRFSYASEDEPVEIVNLRLKAIGRTTKPRFAKERVDKLDPSRAQIGYRQIYFADEESPGAARPVPAALYQREKLASGNIVIGPAALHQLDATTIVAPGWAATVDVWGNLVVERSGT